MKNVDYSVVPWSKEQSDELVRHYGLPVNTPPRFEINLYQDGSVVTADGEILGSWQMDENEHPSFNADGDTEVTISGVGIGFLCFSISDWYAKQNGTYIEPENLDEDDNLPSLSRPF